MKHLNSVFNTNELTPKERVLFMVHDDVAKEQKGEGILTDADRNAIHEKWRPKDNHEVKEYNRFLEGWNIVGYAALDMQTLFLNTQNAHLRKHPIMCNLFSYPEFNEMRTLIKRLKETKSVDIGTAVQITEKQKAVKLKNGLDFDYAVYQLAFELLSEKDKEQLRELYCEVDLDHQYLDQEEVIANLLDSKGELNQKAKEALAEMVAERSYNEFAKSYQLYHYFACIPVAEVARHFLVRHGISIEGKSLAQNQDSDNEDETTHDEIQKAMEGYAKEHNAEIRELLKGSCLQWIDEDLFEQYTPLVFSTSKELFERWINSKSTAMAMLKDLIDKGDLKLRGRSSDESRDDLLYSKRLYDSEFKKGQLALETMGMEFNPQSLEKIESEEKVVFATFSDKVITGESLYLLNSDWKFIDDFKTNVETYHPNLGIVYADDDPDHLDQELIIADKNTAGDFNIFSMFGMATRMLGGLVESSVFFTESEENGERVLIFKSKLMEQIFLRECANLANGYAELLAFEELFIKLSTVYEIDLSYKVHKWLWVIASYIDEHNDHLGKLTGQVPDNNTGMLRKRKSDLKIDQKYFIDKESIEPDREAIEKYVEKFEEVLKKDFN